MTADPPPPTPRWQIAYAAAMSGVIGWCLAYVLCDALGWPRLTYFPYQGAWAVTSGPPAPSTMTYLGTVLWAIAGGAIAAALAALIARARRRALAPRTIALLGGWALGAFGFAGLYYLWNLWPF